MAIREVLTSFTFEQQRQMINLIGADVGDASTLLTPTNVLVSGINEIVNGDVDLINQTHGMDDGTSGSPSLYWDAGQGFYKVDANKIALTTSLSVTGNLEVDGDITFRAGSGSGGTLTFGDLDTDNIVFNADVQSSIVPDSTANYNLGTAAKQWNNLWIDGTASIDTLEVDDNSTFAGYLQVDSGDIRVPNTTTTVDLFDDYATTVEAFGDATSIRIGETSGTLTLRNPTIVGSEATQNLFNTVATTVNAFGAATTINMGVAGSLGVNTNFNIFSDDVVCSGDLNINGGELLSSSATFDLLIAQTDIRIGNSASSGTITANTELQLKEDLKFTNTGGNYIWIPDGLSNALSFRKTGGTTDWMQFRTDSGNERVVVWKDLYVVGNIDISGSTTTIDATTLVVEDKNIELGNVGAPSDATADGGGITLKGATDKTITYNNADGVWKSNIGFAVGPVVGDVLTSQSTTGLTANLFVGKGGPSKVFTVDESGNLKIGTDVTSASTTKVSLNVDGSASFASTVSDSKGDVRDIPQSSNSSARTLVATDGGKVVMTTSGGWVIPASVMSQGNTVTLLNGDGSAQNIDASALNAFYNTADGANIKANTITLGGASMATIWFSSGTVAYISATNMSVS